MDLETEREIHRLFARALDEPPAERAAFVRSSCGDRPAVAPRVTALLAAESDAVTFLERPALATLAASGPGGLEDDLVGQRIGRYTISTRIGSGGMGVVYLAEQESPRRAVALKVMRSALASRIALRRFEHEAQVLGRLQHPNVAQIYEAAVHREPGLVAPLPYFAMEHVEGALPITRYADTKRLDTDARLELFLRVCRGVRHGHQKGVIHRDLKPANILVGVAGEPKIIDFGVARATDRDPAASRSLTGHGQVVGTIRYMSPEQCRGDGADVDVRTDVYALGLVLYELLCGRFPYDLSDVATPELPGIIADRPPARPTTVRPDLAPDLETIVLTALEKDRERRYQAVADLARDVERFRRREPIEARPPSVLYQARLFTRRHRALVGAAVAIVGVLVGATAVSLAFAASAGRERDTALHQSYIANIAAAESAFRSREYRRLRARLDAAPARHRGWEWRYLDAQIDPPTTVLEHDAMVDVVAVHPAGRMMVTGNRDGVLRRWRTDGQESLGATPAHEAIIFALAFNADGTRLASGAADGTVRTWSVGADLTLTPTHGLELVGRVSCVVFSPDSSLLLTAGAERLLRAWDSHDGQLRWSSPVPDEVRALAVSPDGGTLASAGFDGVIGLRDLASGEVRGTLRGHEGHVYALAYSADGRTLYSGAQDATVRVWDVATGVLRSSLAGHHQSVWRLALSAGDAYLASASVDRSIRIWDVATARSVATLYGHADAVVDLAFVGPDRRRLVTASWDSTVRVWDDAQQPGSSDLQGHTDVVDAAVPDPTGRLVASAARDGTLRLWDAVTGESLAVFEVPPPGARALAFDPAGRWLAVGHADGSIAIRDARTARRREVFRAHDARVTCVAFTPDGRGLVSGDQDGGAIIWTLGANAATLRQTLSGHATYVRAVAVSPDGTRVATASWDHTARLWDAATGVEIATLAGHAYTVYAVAFSPDGRTLVTGGRDKTLRVWDGVTGAARRTLRDHGQFVSGLAFSPDGTRLAAASWFGSLMICDAASFEPLVLLRGQGPSLRCVAFAADGARIVTGSTDATVRIWDERPIAGRRRTQAAVRAAQSAAATLVDRLTAEGRTPAQVADAIAADVTRDPVVVHAALNLLVRRGAAPRG